MLEVFAVNPNMSGYLKWQHFPSITLVKTKLQILRLLWRAKTSNSNQAKGEKWGLKFMCHVTGKPESSETSRKLYARLDPVVFMIPDINVPLLIHL